MGSCVQVQTESDPTEKYNHGKDTHNPSTSTNEQTNSELATKDYIRDSIPHWFPSANAHKHVTSQFMVKEKIGNGVTGSVFTILYKKTDSICALKRIARDDEFGRMQFTTEAQVLSKLSHPSIIKYIDMLMDDKYYYLILEKCDYDLWNLMKKYKHLSEKKCKRIIYNLLLAIAHIHNKNLVHRDIKPENIVFSNDTHMPKLIDFGDAEMAKSTKTYTEFVGTPPYMSPERLGEHDANALLKSDIWAIGVLTYEMYSGQRCFNGETQKNVFTNILRGNWQWNKNRMPSNYMKDFVEKCLHLNINERLDAEQALKHEWFDDIERINGGNVSMSEINRNKIAENNFKSSAYNEDIELCEYDESVKTDMKNVVAPIDEYDTVRNNRFESISANIQFEAGIPIEMDEK